MAGSLAKAEVFCSSNSFIESNERSTPFCTISGKCVYMSLKLQQSHMTEYYAVYTGILQVYGVMQITLLIAFHALGLCWGILFPFHYRTFKLAGRIKYIHVTSVVLALVLPAIPSLLHLISGYGIGPGPFDACVGRNSIVTFFTVILPLSILMAIATSALVIIFWKILKVRKSHEL